MFYVELGDGMTAPGTDYVKCDCTKSNAIFFGGLMQPRVSSLVKQLSAFLPTWPALQSATGYAYIDDPKDSGFIGEDREYRFQERLCREDDRPFVLDHRDYYLKIRAVADFTHPLVSKIEYLRRFFFFLPSLKKELTLTHMPSSLFQFRNEGDTVSFKLDGRNISLELRQLRYPDPAIRRTFESAREEAYQFAYREYKYLFAQDKLPGTLSMGETDVSRSSIWLKANGAKEQVTSDNLSAFAEHYRHARKGDRLGVQWVHYAPGNDGYEIAFCLPGLRQEDVQFLIDEDRIYIYRMAPSVQIAWHDLPQKIDKDRVTIFHGRGSICSMVIPYFRPKLTTLRAGFLS